MSLRMRSKLLFAVAVAGLAACAGAPLQPGARYEATLTRTTFGIAHITAPDYAGLGFGAAYTRAQDNLCLLAEAYASAAGERAKHFGGDAESLIALRPGKNIDSDFYHHLVTDLPALRVAFGQTSADFQAMVDGWMAGYNRYLRDHADRLPAACAGKPWVREITLDDALRTINTFAVQASSGAFAVPLASAAPPLPGATPVATAPAILDAAPGGAMLGSNAWAFGGESTANGRGLVVGNPHFPWIGPNRFYETHLTIPGQLDVAGAAIMTMPFVGIGFNRDVAWSHTTDMAAHMTLVRLALDPADPTAYVVDGQREAMTRREIHVEGADGSAVVRTLYATRFGPMISVPGTRYEWTRQTAYALTDANLGNLRSGDTWIGIARARSVGEVRAALAQRLGVAFLNTLAADRHGDALYADIAAVPNLPAERFASGCATVEDRLPGQLQDLYVLDGSRTDCGWVQSSDAPVAGLLPASQQAALTRRDFVQSSNDSYRWSQPKAVQQLGPVMGRDPGLGGLRTQSALREIDRVLQASKFDVDLGAQTMLANKSFAAELALPALLKLCAGSKAVAEPCAALKLWDGRAELDSRGAMLFNVFWGKVGARHDIWRRPLDPDDYANTPRDLITEGKVGEELLAALASAAQELKARGLALDATLADSQFVMRGSERIPISGAQYGGVLNYVRNVPAPTGYSLIVGTSYLQSVGFDEHGPVAKAVLAYSQSADPASPHFADQTREFSHKRLRRFPYSTAEVAADAITEPLTIRQ